MADRKEDEQPHRETEAPPKGANWKRSKWVLSMSLAAFIGAFFKGLGQDSYSVTKQFATGAVGDATPQTAKSPKRIVVLSAAHTQSGEVRTGFLGLGGVVHRAEFRVTLTNLNVVDVPRASINFSSRAGNVFSVAFPSMLNATMDGERRASPWVHEGDYPTREVTLEMDMPKTNMWATFPVVVYSEEKPISSNDVTALLLVGDDYWSVQSK